MEFFAVNGKRPTRLCEETRQFAWDSLSGEYGRQTRCWPSVSLDDVEEFEKLTALEQHDLAIERIAAEAPIRICKHEKVSGSATLGYAVHHYVPAQYKGQLPFRSISHLTIDFETVLTRGVGYIEQQAKNAFERYKGTEKEPFVRSCLRCLTAMRVWHGRYVEALATQPAYADNYRALLTVPFAPATTFYEAVQSLWFTFAFVRLCGNWPGIGRLDWLLGPYLERDLDNGTLTLEQAREILAHFFIKGCEWIRGGNYGTGDAQHYQNILLGGVDENGNDVTNAVTYLVLDVLEELGISDFPTTVRLNRHTDPRLLTRVAEVIRYGGGVVAVYNEELIVESLVDYGYPLPEARTFANDGCWEVQIPGKTYFVYIPFDSLQVLQQKTLKEYDGTVFFSDFESLYRAFMNDVKQTVQDIVTEFNGRLFVSNEGPSNTWKWAPAPPCTVVSLFEQGCIENGRSYLEGGPRYNVISPHIGGLPDAVNSLYAIKKLVFDEQKIAFGELLTALKNDWQGYESLRLYALNKEVYYGNDNDEVDTLAARIVEGFADICDSMESGYRTPAGISTFGRQLEWSVDRMATPYGKRQHGVLAGNFSPTPGTDKAGATAQIKSYCKANLKRMVSGAALDVKLLPATVNGDNGLEALVSLLRGFVALGGHFM